WLLAAACLAISDPVHGGGHAGLTGCTIAGDGRTPVTINSLASPGDISFGHQGERHRLRPGDRRSSELFERRRIYVIDPAMGAMTDLGEGFAL
ncbi:MAG: hypothetical protein AAF631_03545, partial [Pseudomonadota bacterium]